MADGGNAVYAPATGQCTDGTDTRKVRGVVKWFDQTKGYGFMTPEDGSRDVMIHSSCLRTSGLTAPAEGAEITCEAVERAKGLQAVKILDMGTTVARPSAQPTVPLDGEPMRAMTVKWFSRAKGYGFLQEDGLNEDIFIHMETVRAGGFAELDTGQRLAATTVRGPKGLMARSVGPLKAH